AYCRASHGRAMPHDVFAPHGGAPFPDNAAMTSDAEKLLALALPAIKDYALLLLDPQGTIVGWRCGAEQIFGYTEQEALGRDLALLFTPEDLERGLHRLELEIAARDSASQDDRWHLRKDGTRIWASGTVTAVR